MPHKSKFSYEQLGREYIIVSNLLGLTVNIGPFYPYRHLVINS